ncbi:MAG TPA: hypothetical protein VE685_17600 [Thermoanaerobaculia bacterium]|nr:hypothetical protein [Thermoanaerobaculia bacterium]
MRRRVAFTLGLAGLALAPIGAGAIQFTANLDSIKIEARAGEVVTRNFQLHLAPGQEKVHFRSRIEDWWQSEDGSQSFYRPPGTLSRSCGPWIELNPVEAAVDPGGTLSVRITASVPRGLAPGGYWCVLSVDELPDPLAVPQGVEVRFLSSISVGIFVSVEPVRREVEISDVGVAGGELKVRVRNAGNGPLGVEGRVEFIEPGGSALVATAVVPRATVLTEPVASRILTARLPDVSTLPSGRYMVRVILDAGLDHYIGVQKLLEISNEHRRMAPGR